MIYNFGLYNEIYYYLLKNLPTNSIKNITKLNKLEQIVKEDDIILFFNWTRSARKVQERLANKGITMFPDIKLVKMIGDRVTQLKLLENITAFPAERIYIENNTHELNTTITPTFKSGNKIVIKIGNDHQGQSKYIKSPGDIIKTRENIVFEEYIKNARSIRILLISDNKDDIFIIEHLDDPFAYYKKHEEKWIKNISPIEKVYHYNDRYDINISNIDDIIADALNLMKYLKQPYLGIDYVVNDKKVVFLEVNDMIGLPDDKRIFDKAKKFFLDYCSNIRNK